MKDVKIDEIIIGYVKPSIYAFETSLIPNCLKVGDTCRPVNMRLNEWRQKYPDLEKRFEAEAIVDENVFFRDYQIHSYLIEVEKKERVERESVRKGVYYSSEFFRNTTATDVEAAINDIRKDYEEHTGKYKYFDSSRLAVIQAFKPEGVWKPYKEQKETINRFMEAYHNGRKNLLMYAVMRFGKSFTTMCCAKKMDAKVVVILSAKKDVEREWRANVQKPDNFNKQYVFINSDALVANPNIISESLQNKNVVVFLTLQDLQGQEIKEKHKELFEHEIDLLVVDETHYGARAEKFGEVLRNTECIDETTDVDEEELFIDEQVEEIVKKFTSKIVLHLSGTPYRILLDNEFSEEDIIAFYQYSDIIKAQQEWGIKNPEEDEWNNPYFGFPQMIRFAFNLNPSAKKIIEELKANGQSGMFSELFRPLSIKKDENRDYRRFIHEKEVLDLLKIVDGSKNDAGILSFLDNERIKSGKLCQHVVFVLPYCASCDAMEEILLNHKGEFKNLQDYKILNISGVDGKNTFPSTDSVVSRIDEYEKEGEKTLTLTVNRMLTGTTVKQWDTMVFLKDTSSPQEYDQAIFRLQSKYIHEYCDEDGCIIKQDMKPQTILVDFDPMRVFSMQESQSKIFNIREGLAGNNSLLDKMGYELTISPIITMNAGAIQKIEPIDIVEKISQYSRDKGVYEEAHSVPVDFNLLNNELIKEEIDKQNEIGSINGFQVGATENGTENLDLSDFGNGNKGQGNKSGGSHSDKTKKRQYDETERIRKMYLKKFDMFYARILFFAFLTDDTVVSLEDIISACTKPDNRRILNNLGLNLSVIKIIQASMNKLKLIQLDYAIYKSNYKSTDEDLEPIERVRMALKKFDRFSETEVQTSEEFVKKMLDDIPDEDYLDLAKNKKYFIDMASTVGEFVIGFYQKLSALNVPLEEFKDLIVAIPSSPIAYEFIKKIYKILGLNENAIVDDLVAAELVDNVNHYSDLKYSVERIRSNNVFKKAPNKDEDIFGVIAGNPPYNRPDKKTVYHHMVSVVKMLNPVYISFLIPAKWYSGGKGLRAFRKEMLSDSRIKKIVDYENTKDVFPVDLPGGICQFLWARDYQGLCNVENNGDNLNILERNLSEFDVLIRRNKDLQIVKKIVDKRENFLTERVSSRNPFGISTNYKPRRRGIQCYFKVRTGVGYVAKNDVMDENGYLDKWKVLAKRLPIAGETDFSKSVGIYSKTNTFIAPPNSCCSDTYIVLGAFDNEAEAKSYYSYISTKIVRFLISQLVVSADVSNRCFSLVPDIEKYDHIISDGELAKKWGITCEEWEYIDLKIKSFE